LIGSAGDVHADLQRDERGDERGDRRRTEEGGERPERDDDARDVDVEPVAAPHQPPVGPASGDDLHDRGDERTAGGDESVGAQRVARHERRDATLQEDAEDRAPHGLDAEPEGGDPGRLR
jgi:hypothetical protein